jgi:multiple sugar transport system permease protein
MSGRRGWRWWAANLALGLSSALFLVPFVWLLLTALKPIEQTMKFQWLPKSYRAPMDGKVYEVIKEREISEDSVIVVVEEGARKGERLLLPASAWDGSAAEVEEQIADVVRKVRRATRLEADVPAGSWRVREKLLRKYAGHQPRWTCVPAKEIEERTRLWWENFILAVEYLSDTDEMPLETETDGSLPEKAGGGGLPTVPRLSFRWGEQQAVDLARYHLLRLRARAEQDSRLALRAETREGETLTLKEGIRLSPGVQDIDISLPRLLRAAGKRHSCRLNALWFDQPAAAGTTTVISEARLILNRATFWTYLGNTLTVCLLGCIGTVLSSSLVAYGFSRVQWPGRDRVFWAVLATMMIPFPVTMIPLFGVFKGLGWVGTLKPLWVPAFFGSAFNIFLLRQFFLTIPQELSDAARIDGCSEFGIYWRIILPLSKPALAVVFLFHFLYAWNDFMGPLIYLTRPETFTLSLALQFYQSQHGGSEWHLLMAMSVLILLPVVVLFFLTQKTFIQGIATTGMKG